jgi:LuxR family maltose regulon positive regulatory protein
MPEAYERSPQKPAADRPEGILATKLFLPRTPPGFVLRPRLVKQLQEGMVRELVLACAPAGFGKTALLADWSQRGQRPVAWLSLDPGDNDPVRFWRHAAAALDRVRPGIAEQVAPLLGQPAPASFEGVVTALINELAAEPGEVLLVLDDYHLIEAQSVHRSLTFLLEHLPPGVHLVLASRSDPPLPLARLRAHGQLVELRAADLRFTANEAAALLREAGAPDLGEDVVAALATRSDGWAAGLKLAALSLRGQPDAAEFVATFSGSYRYVMDFLTEEVLEGLPPPVRGFLLETSVLDRLAAPLCDAVTGRTDGQAMLETIERANLFLVPLDEVRGWWRYHPLFADLLRSRLQQQEPQRMPVLHRNAAAWSEENGLADDAVRHAVAAADPLWAARLIERHSDELVLRGEGATVQRWLAALPAELVGRRPRLLLVQALLALLDGRVEAVEAPLEAAERFAADAADEPYEPSVGRAASALANVPAAIALDRAHLAELLGDADRAIAFGRRALVEIGEGESLLRSIAAARLAVAQWLDGRLEDAERGLVVSIGRWRAAGERYLPVRGCHYLGLVRRAQGRLDAALETYQQALQIAAPSNRPALPAAGAVYVGMAEVAYQRGDLGSALRQVTDGIALCRQLTNKQPLATGLATLAWIRRAKGDVLGTAEAIAEAARVAPSPDVADLLNPVPAQRARLLLAYGDLATATQWIEERGLRAEDDVSYPREPGYLVLARLLLASDATDRALALLDPLYADAAAHGRNGSVIEIQALRALALAAGGDEPAGLVALAEALTLAVPQGYIRVFVDEGRAMGALVGQLIATQQQQRAAAAGVPVGYLGRLAQAFEGDADGEHTAARSSSPIPAGLVVGLSARELEVLRLLAAGKRNWEIAAELYVTRDTVKKHVTHILDKLGAASRTQAAARAREIGLLG